MVNKIDEFYTPVIKENTKISGITVETIPNGQAGRICTKSFIMSDSKDFNKFATQLIRFFIGSQLSSINRLLVLVKKDFTAKIYKDFPVSIKIKSKESLKKGMVVMSNQIADISAVKFMDALGEVDIADGDQILWLTRENWRFGLYFDFSQTLKTESLAKELAWIPTLVFILNTTRV